MSAVVGQLVKVRIEWMDGQVEEIDAAVEPRVHDGVLRIQRYDHAKPGFTGGTVNFPVANIRSWE